MEKQNGKFRQKQLKGVRGITLIALVITIIVLLILAAVSIATLTGDNGILTKANTAKTTNDSAQAEEEMKLLLADWQLEKRSNSGADLGEFLNSKKANGELDNVTDNKDGSYTIEVNGYETTISDEEGLGEIAEIEPPKETIFKNIDTRKTYPDGSMPTGAKVLEENGKELNDADEGIVIIDDNKNEWVWIEVPKSVMPKGIKFENETGYSEEDEEKSDTITVALKTYADSYTKGAVRQHYANLKDEWYAQDTNGTIISASTGELTDEQKTLNNGCGLTLSEYKEKYQKMIKSVYKNGGFWIGRYESGIDETTGTDEESLKLGRTSSSARIDDVSTAPKAISQKDAIPYNWITCSEAQKLANGMTPDSSKTSSLLFGIQWNLVCKFIEEKEVKKQGESYRTSIISSINSNSREWGNYNEVHLENLSGNAKGYSDTKKIWSKIITKLSYEENNDNTLLSTGASEQTKKINIYDFAGNEAEWILEKSIYGGAFPWSCKGGHFMYSAMDTVVGSASSYSTPYYARIRCRDFVSYCFVLKFVKLIYEATKRMVHILGHPLIMV